MYAIIKYFYTLVRRNIFGYKSKLSKNQNLFFRDRVDVLRTNKKWNSINKESFAENDLLINSFSFCILFSCRLVYCNLWDRLLLRKTRIFIHLDASKCLRFSKINNNYLWNFLGASDTAANNSNVFYGLPT